ncbi:MAG TPA: MFS transporter [Sphingomonas sp.]|nr:MFS transporter [Sphingomonas sp.]
MESTIDRRRWLIVVLAFTAIMLNYVDRQIIALLKPTLQGEFGWNDRDYSHMASAFQFSAAIAFLGTGWFIDRIGLRKGFAFGVGLWSLAGMVHAAVSSVTGFVAARAVLGAAESIGTPAQVKTAAVYFPPEQRSMMIGIGNMASNLGAVAAPLTIPPLALWLGWRAAFLITGGLGFVWVVAWLMVRPPREAAAAVTQAAKVPWAAMLRERRQWALVAAKTFSDNVWWFLLFFTPDLFHRRFGLDQGTLGLPVAFIYAMAALGSLSGGFLPSRLLMRGASTDRARKGSMLVYALLILPTPLVIFTHSAWAGAALLGLALFAHQGFSTNVFGMATDIFPSRMVGTAIGIGAFAGNLAGMAMIEGAGWSLDKGYGYPPMLIICGCSYLVALALIQLLVPRIVIAEPSTDRAAVLAH